jgi:hypothetical protein
MLAMEPASLVMERKMLLGIKQRAELLARSASASGSSRVRRTGVSRKMRDHQQVSALPC